MVGVYVNGTTFHVADRQQVDFWDSVRGGIWEPNTFAMMERILDPDWRFVDIGAWIGPTTLYAAKRCRSVDSYECDPVALSGLKDNLRLNPDIADRVVLHEFALGDRECEVKFYSRSLGNSETSMFSTHERQEELLECDQEIYVGMRDVKAVFRERGYANCDRTLVKIDIEGSEFRILPCLTDYARYSRCVWLVSFHELNLNPAGFPARPYRVAEMIRSLSSMANLNWFDEKGFRLVHAEVLDRILDGSWPFHQTFVFTSKEVL